MSTQKAFALSSVLWLTAVLAGCNNSTSKDGDASSRSAYEVEQQSAQSISNMSVAPAPVSQDIASGGSASTAAPPFLTSAAESSMIIRSGYASIEVDSLETAVQAIHRIATSFGGTVGNTTLTAGKYQVRSATIELRIPAASFDEAVGGLNGIGKLESVQSNAQDVGEEFVDVTARTANAKRLEERLVVLLATRVGKLEEVLSVERELARVREDIERYEGRMRYLQSRVATSTLTVNVHEAQPLVSPNPGRTVIGDAFLSAWKNFVGLIAAVIASLGVILPIAAVALPAVVWVRRRKRNARSQ